MHRAVPILAVIAALCLAIALVVQLRTPGVPNGNALAEAHAEQEAEEAAQSSASAVAPTPKQLDARFANFDRAIRKRPRDPQPRAAKMHLALQHRPGLAETMARELLEADEENTYAMTHLAASLAAKGRVDHALHYAAKAVQVEDGAAHRLYLATLLDAAGRHDQAAEQRRLAASR